MAQDSDGDGLLVEGDDVIDGCASILRLSLESMAIERRQILVEFDCTNLSSMQCHINGWGHTREEIDWLLWVALEFGRYVVGTGEVLARCRGGYGAYLVGGSSVARDEEYWGAPKLYYGSMKSSVSCDKSMAAHLMWFLPAHFAVKEQRIAGRKRRPAMVEPR